jgi:23S rRNA (adenine2503-C2)-methyltransferase
LRFAHRRVTVSTAGLAPKLADLGRDTNVNLAVSLNATENRTRSMLMPINRKYPIEKLLEACRNYQLPPGRKITFEYILLKGINDTRQDAVRLAKLLRPIRAKINLIPFNPHPGSHYKRPDESVIKEFQDFLIAKNYTVMIRQSKGQDISAACGQLRADGLCETPAANHASASSCSERFPT